MRVIITSGGTAESIDQVRKITNLSTGRLGSLIADAFSTAGCEVVYLCGERALQPSLPVAEIRQVGSVQQLWDTLTELLREPCDCVVHAMAVSDYTPCAVTTVEDLAMDLAAKIQGMRSAPTGEQLAQLMHAALRGDGVVHEKKISSNLDNMLMMMERTPKVIGRIKELRPDILLVGFKLLAGVPERELLQVAGALLDKNGCDFVLANDQEKMKGDRHEAILMGPQGAVCRMATKQEIAQGIARAVLEKAGQKNE